MVALYLPSPASELLVTSGIVPSLPQSTRHIKGLLSINTTASSCFDISFSFSLSKDIVLWTKTPPLSASPGEPLLILKGVPTRSSEKGDPTRSSRSSFLIFLFFYFILFCFFECGNIFFMFQFYLFIYLFIDWFVCVEAMQHKTICAY